eukprot:CFRG6242T1
MIAYTLHYFLKGTAIIILTLSPQSVVATMHGITLLQRPNLSPDIMLSPSARPQVTMSENISDQQSILTISEWARTRNDTATVVSAAQDNHVIVTATDTQNEENNQYWNDIAQLFNESLVHFDADWSQDMAYSIIEYNTSKIYLFILFPLLIRQVLYRLLNI